MTDGPSGTRTLDAVEHGDRPSGRPMDRPTIRPRTADAWWRWTARDVQAWVSFSALGSGVLAIGMALAFGWPHDSREPEQAPVLPAFVAPTPSLVVELPETPKPQPAATAQRPAPARTRSVPAPRVTVSGPPDAPTTAAEPSGGPTSAPEPSATLTEAPTAEPTPTGGADPSGDPSTPPASPASGAARRTIGAEVAVPFDTP
jgi:hypothetical protein